MSGTNSLVEVNVRIEGRDKTQFEGSVTTNGKIVTTRTGGTHPANGTNGNEYPFPVPTCTSALQDASRLTPTFTWDGIYYVSLDDVLVTRIGADAAGDDEYWQLALNFRRATLGGGQTKVEKADSVVWALIENQQAPANGLPLLKLKGCQSATTNTDLVVTVIDGETRQPVQGATVKEIQTGGTGSWLTKNDGRATVKFTGMGMKVLKAEHVGKYVRSNALTVAVN